MHERVVIAASSSPRAARPRLGVALLRTQPDGRLAELAGQGSEVAFEEIVRRYRAALVAFATRITSRDSADDVVQDSMVKAHAALLRGNGPASVRPWLFAIVKNTALNALRDQRVHQPLDESHDGVEQPPEAIDRRGRFRDLVRAIGSLPAAQRHAIVRRELEGRGHDEIARELQISPGAVRQLIFRARSALRAGAGFLLPMQLLRAAVISGAADQAGSGAAAGAGIAAKLGIGALVTTGALVAGTNAVKHEAAPTGHRPAVAQAATTPERKIERLATERSTASSATSRRERVVVTPNVVSRAKAATPVARAPTRNPHEGNPDPGTHTGAQPPPTGSGGPSGSAGPGGDQTSGESPGAQTSSAPTARDCKQDGDRDPAPADGSPG